MIYKGDAIVVEKLDDGTAELRFDLKGESVNKFNRATLDDLKAATAAIAAADGVTGLLVTSGKDVFIVGADITEFGAMFAGSEEDMIKWSGEANAIFNAVEDLDMPSVTAINGLALGGGFEMCLSTDYRVMADSAQVGFPEVKLGIIPGFGGTVRMPRLTGADNAIEWISAGKQFKAEDALKTHAVDAVVTPEKLRDAAIKVLDQAREGRFDWRARRAMKKGKLSLQPIDSMMVFETAKGFIAGQAGPHYPAPVEAVKCMQKAAGMDRDGALKVEAKGFAKVARTSVAECLIGLFMSDQLLKKKAKHWGKQAADVDLAAVLGAGIMGGGIAYQSASKGTPILMKDINDAALDLGLNEAAKLLDKLVSRGKMSTAKMAQVMGNIRPTLSYGDFNDADIVVEAVVENPKVKKMVLGELEDKVTDDTIITSNTSTISIDELAADLKRPENFCGMHFFNPVHRMPLVEVIRGEKSSDKAIATTVAYATKMGKTAIVVNNCPGFLVNRILFPYFAGFQILVNEGADFAKVDKVMERFGWPMGPAYLLDVVGIDTAHHAGEVMAVGFPERLGGGPRTSLDVLYENERFGQKNGKGYYRYELDRKGKPKKMADADIAGLLKDVVSGSDTPDDEVIIDRLMLPMLFETARCLEEGIVETPNEADMGLIFGIGFPPFRGGALKYADTVGLDSIIEKAKAYESLGPIYQPTDRMIEMAKSGERYYK